MHGTTVKNVYWFSCKEPIVFVIDNCSETFNFLGEFFKNTELSNFMAIHPVGTEMFHADRWTDSHDEANSQFSQFCERASKKVKMLLYASCRQMKRAVLWLFSFLTRALCAIERSASHPSRSATGK